MLNIESKGESPISWRLTTFPRDARTVLRLRFVTGLYQRVHQMEGPVADLEAEQVLLDNDPRFEAVHNEVNQPITFLLPTPVLRFLARLW